MSTLSELVAESDKREVEIGVLVAHLEDVGDLLETLLAAHDAEVVADVEYESSGKSEIRRMAQLKKAAARQEAFLAVLERLKYIKIHEAQVSRATDVLATSQRQHLMLTEIKRLVKDY